MWWRPMMYLFISQLICLWLCHMQLWVTSMMWFHVIYVLNILWSDVTNSLSVARDNLGTHACDKSIIFVWIIWVLFMLEFNLWILYNSMIFHGMLVFCRHRSGSWPNDSHGWWGRMKQIGILGEGWDNVLASTL